LAELVGLLETNGEGSSVKPDLFVLGLLPLTGGVSWLFCAKWIKDSHLRFYQKYEPRIWNVEIEPSRVLRVIRNIPLWLIRVTGAALILIGISVLDTAVNSH
jgi:hypothetical protein